MKKRKIILSIDVTTRTYDKLMHQCEMKAFDCNTPGELFRFICDHKLRGVNNNIETILVSEEEYDTKGQEQ